MINLPSDSVMNRILSRAAQMKGGVKGGLKANSDAPATIEEATADMGQALVPEAMTMEMAMLSPVTPERAFYSPLSNGPQATTFNAPRPTTFNGPRPSTMNAPLMPEPVEFMEPAPLPELRQPAAPQPFVPPMVNGMEDWGSQVYNPDGGMRSIADLRQLPPRVQGELVRQNPLLQSYFPQTPRLEPAQATGTPEDMATMARYQGGLDAIPARPTLEPSPMGKTYIDGPGGFQEAQGFAPRIPGMPTPPGLADPMEYDQGFTMDFGGSRDTFLGTREKPLSSEARRAKLEQDLADAIDTNDPAKAQMLQGALGALNGGAGGGLTFEQKKQLQDDKIAAQKDLSADITGRTEAALGYRRGRDEQNAAIAELTRQLKVGEVTAKSLAEVRQAITAQIEVNKDMLENTYDPGLKARLNTDTLKLRNRLDDISEVLINQVLNSGIGGGQATETPKPAPGGGAPKPKPVATPTPTPAPQKTEQDLYAELEAEILQQFPGLSREELANRVVERLEELGYE